MNIKEVEKISRALGDPYRLRIIEAAKAANGWLPYTYILNMFSLAQSTTSHHIKQLTNARLLIALKEGRNIKYQLNKEHFAAYTKYLVQFE